MSSDFAPMPAMASEPYKQFVSFLESATNVPNLIEFIVFPDGKTSSVDASQRMRTSCSTVFAYEELVKVIQEWAFYHNGHLSPRCPTAGGSLWRAPGRWQAAMSPVIRRGAILCLRKHLETPDALRQCFLDQPQMQSLLQDDPKIPTLIYGDTGSGKSTLMFSLLQSWSQQERVIILEKDAECPNWFPNWILLSASKGVFSDQAEVGFSELTSLALRLRPDRICVSEIRMDEALCWLHAMNVGHGGVLATMHGKSPTDVIARLELLVGKSRLFRSLEGKSIRLVGMQRAEPAAISSVCKIRFSNSQWRLLTN